MKGPARVIFSAPRRHAWSRRCAMCFSRDAPPTDAARPARARLASVVSAIKAILGLISRCLDLSSRLSLRLTSATWRLRAWCWRWRASNAARVSRQPWTVAGSGNVRLQVRFDSVLNPRLTISVYDTSLYWLFGQTAAREGPLAHCLPWALCHSMLKPRGGTYT
jgi:hypothetical protein